MSILFHKIWIVLELTTVSINSAVLPDESSQIFVSKYATTMHIQIRNYFMQEMKYT